MPVRDVVTDDLIDFLNALVAIDRYAIAELLCTRVVCNKTMADHPSVQVAAGREDMQFGEGFAFLAPGQFRVGMLGILNGFCGTIEQGPRKGWGPITAIYDKGLLVGFKRTNENPEPQS
jgi:hypothetical protein